MKLKAILLLGAIFTVIAVMGTGAQVFAGPEIPYNNTGTIVGPELWGVIVIDCEANHVATLRVKRVVDCNVETQAVVAPVSGCPADETSVLHWTFESQLFNINPNHA